jgi:hypothetical protein
MPVLPDDVAFEFVKGDGVENNAVDVALCCVGSDGVGVDEVDGRVMSNGGGINPPGESSVAPKGIPALVTGATPVAVGDEADAAGCAKLLASIVLQVPEAVPALAAPAPLNSVADVGVPAMLSVPDSSVLVELPAWAQFAALPTDSPSGKGLSPGVESSTAPNGIPVKPIGGAGPMPRGEVTPRGEAGAPPTTLTCAAAVPKPKTTKKTEMTNDLPIRGFPHALSNEQPCLAVSGTPSCNSSTPPIEDVEGAEPE